MHNILFRTLIFYSALTYYPELLFSTATTSQDVSLTAIFTPPEGWQYAEAKSLPRHVKVMVVGKGAHQMPPSINLGYEEYNGTLKDYLKIVKEINESQGDQWKDLGMIDTQAGPGNLSQVDIQSEWGKLRLMHLILLHDKVVYILTVSALKDEFSKFYPVFFQTIKSFRLQKNNEIENKGN